MPRRVRLARFAIPLLLLAGGSLFSLLLVEVGLRAVERLSRREVPAPSDNPWTFYQYDPVLGWRPRSGVEGFFQIPDSRTRVRTSEQGLRDVEHAYAKGERLRILALGDSFTWGYGVEEGERFTDRLQLSLGDGVEVIDAAVTGYGTDQELLYLAMEGVKYAPDVVLLCFGTEDILNNHNAVQYTYPKPYFEIKHGALRLRNVPVPPRESPWHQRYGLPPDAESLETQPMWQASADGDAVRLGKSLRRFLRRHFATYRFLRDRVWTGLHPQPSEGQPSDAAAVLEDPLTEALLLRVRQVADTIGAELVVVMIPYREDATQGQESPAWRGATAFLEREGFHFVDLSPAFLEAADPRALFLRIDPHWSPLGHEVAAAALADQLRRQHLLPTPHLLAARPGPG